MYATDIILSRLIGPAKHARRKKYYSEKHMLYGFKFEVSVLLNGISVLCSYHYPESTSDINIFHHMQMFHRIAIGKESYENDIAVTGIL